MNKFSCHYAFYPIAFSPVALVTLLIITLLTFFPVVTLAQKKLILRVPHLGRTTFFNNGEHEFATSRRRLLPLRVFSHSEKDQSIRHSKLYLLINDRNIYPSRSYFITVNEPTSSKRRVKVKSQPLLERGRCALSEQSSLNFNHKGKVLSNTLNLKSGGKEVHHTLNLSVMLDDTFIERVGTFSEAASLVTLLTKGASSLMEVGLGVTVNLIRVEDISGKLSRELDDTTNLLSSFQRLIPKRASDVNAYHLFTSRSFNDKAIGLGFMSSVCLNPDFAASLSTSYHPAGDITLLAHELTHLIGGAHDNSLPETVMYPEVGIPGAMLYSLNSVAEVRHFLSTNGSCLQREKAPPTVSTPPAVDEPINDLPINTPVPVTENYYVPLEDLFPYEVEPEIRLRRLQVRGRRSFITGEMVVDDLGDELRCSYEITLTPLGKSADEEHIANGEVLEGLTRFRINLRSRGGRRRFRPYEILPSILCTLPHRNEGNSLGEGTNIEYVGPKRRIRA